MSLIGSPSDPGWNAQTGYPQPDPPEDWLSATYAARTLVEPATVRTGRAVPIGDVATWSVDTSGAGTVTTGTDATAGDYVRLTATTVGAAYRAGRDLAVRLDGGQRVVSMLVRRNDANLSVFDLWAMLGAWGVASNKGIKWNKGVGSLDVGRWVRIVVNVAERESVIGAPAYDDMRSLAIQVTPTAGNTTSVDIADIRVHETGASPGRLAFTFDDGRADTYTAAFPRLNAKGWPGGIAVEYAAVGNANRCTLAQLNEMYAAGWDMYGHHSGGFVGMTTTDQQTHHRGAKAFLAGNGFQRGDRIWVWPGGQRDASTEAIAQRYWHSLRRVSVFQQYGTPHVYDPWSPPHLYMGAGTSLSYVQDRIDRLAAHGGSLVLVFHSLVASGAVAEDWLIDNFQALVDYVATKNVRVVPASELWTA